MKRKMVWLGIPWLIGLYFAATCQISVTTSLLLAAFLLLGAFRLYRRITTAQMLTAGLSAAAAVGAVLLYTTMVYQPLLAHAGTITTFSGRVTTVTTYDNDRASYQLKGQFRDGKKAKILVYTDDVGAQYGDTLDVAGTFSVPSDSYLWNTGSYYKAKGIFLQADTKDYISCTHTENGKLVRALQAYRSRISMRICTLAGTDAGGMVSAMLLGTKETLSEETDALLTHHGIRHVVSVSGLHLVLILSIWGFLCRKLHFHRWLTFGTTAVWTALYALMVGAPISILRAGFMFLMMQSAPLFFRKADTCNSLCIAGILMTIGNPYLIQDASFLLSYTGTFAVGVFAPWMTRKMRKKGFEWSLFRQLTTVTCVSVCIFPVTLLYFREVSVASPIANLLLVPICSLMLMLSLAIFLTGGVGIIAKPVCFCLKLLYDGMMLLGYGLRTLIPVMFPTGWKQLPLLSSILILFVLTVICFRRNRRTAAASIAVSFGILIAGQGIYRLSEQRCFTVTVLGQRQEEVVLVAYAGKTDVIDLTGDHRNPRYVQAYCAEQGIRRLDTLCLTKRADQLRVAYPQTLSEMTAAETAVPANCWIPPDADFMGTKPLQTDKFVVEDTQYSILESDGTLLVKFGNLCFCVGTAVSYLPEEEVDALICTQWNGDPEQMPEETYEKDDAVQIRVYPDGTWDIEQLS